MACKTEHTQFKGSLFGISEAGHCCECI